MRRVEPAIDAVFAAVGDGGVVVHTGTKRYYSLNATGARIWSLLESDGDPEAAAAAIVTEYGIKDEEATQAVERLVSDLLAAGLVHRLDDRTAGDASEAPL